MKPRISGVLISIVLFATINVHAKTASQVFEVVSPSIVIIQTYDANSDAIGFGSGVVLSKGVIATNYHVIKDAQKIQVVHRGKEYPAILRHLDWDRDVCTLSVGDLKAPPVVLGDTSQIKVGAQVYAVGAPQGLELTLTEGIVSSLREVEGGHYIQTTAAISPGSSGGGLFDEHGRLLGLMTFYLAESQSLNFAVPVEWIKELPKQHLVAVKPTEAAIDWENKAIDLGKREVWIPLFNHTCRWTEIKPQDYKAWFFQGLAYDKLGLPVWAITPYMKALKINPKYAEAWYNLGLVYDQLGQRANALEAYQQAIRVNPKYAEAWYNLGHVYDQLGKRKEAMDVYEKLKTLDSALAEDFSRKFILH